MLVPFEASEKARRAHPILSLAWCVRCVLLFANFERAIVCAHSCSKSIWMYGVCSDEVAILLLALCVFICFHTSCYSHPSVIYFRYASVHFARFRDSQIKFLDWASSINKFHNGSWLSISPPPRASTLHRVSFRKPMSLLTFLIAHLLFAQDSMIIYLSHCLQFPSTVDTNSCNVGCELHLCFGIYCIVVKT